MSTEIILLCFGIGIGAAIVIGAWQMREKIMFKQLDNALNHNDFCEVGCGYYEQCFARNKNPDDAMDDLVHDYCYNCPLEQARVIVQNNLK